jgi:hypothetical protein
LTSGHRQAQALWAQLGKNLGFRPVGSASAAHPTDGVWLPALRGPRFAAVPIAAAELIVSESRKTLRGSIVTLECVSPALAVVLVHEQEIRRRSVRRGATPAAAARQVQLLTEQATSLAAQSRQRIEVWTYERLVRRVAATMPTSHRLAA